MQTRPAESFELLREQIAAEAPCRAVTDDAFAEGTEGPGGSSRPKCEWGIWVEGAQRKC